MSSQVIAESVRQHGLASDSAWRMLREASGLATTLEAEGRTRLFKDGPREGLRALPGNSTDADLVWHPGRGWECRLPVDDSRRELLNLYLPICSATLRHPLTVGHLGQSLDGFIATPTGDSQFVTGEQNLLHMHRMRALSDAVVVGAGTVAADDPQLTTRMVEGPNALRVVFDPARRLNAKGYCLAIATRMSSSGSIRWSASSADVPTSIWTQLTSPVKALGTG